MLRIVFMLAFLVISGGACHAARYDPMPGALKEAREEARAEADVQAQVDMVYWARMTFLLTTVSVVIAAVGIVGLAFNFWQTRKALQHANRSNELAELQGRPWLQFENIRVRHTEINGKAGKQTFMCIVSFDVANTGLSPALLAASLQSVDPPSAHKEKLEAIMQTIETCSLEGIFIAPGEKRQGWFMEHGVFTADGTLPLMAVFAVAYSDGARSRRMHTVLTGFLGIRQGDTVGMKNETPLVLTVAMLQKAANIDIMQQMVVRMA
ncbi:Hypothetical protein NGAL_HAMBI1145_22740 [Neorhizobium galegae bv. officinalis]|uniref:Transmembrane protein n=1 Tax=Neorhizobium galegae bv. officinalis TaxID=323656 RepID=A0A0T7FGY6_NEOGA|nr:hypothetical protein [Neorhizobium galegae]CDZ34270.1 Hypothetical protein NGAL_HAMBI1145_22740 [Neorhizobium galegae bv. officinalis]